jgi:hypothetical protein
VSGCDECPTPVFDIRPHFHEGRLVEVYFNRHLRVDGVLACTKGHTAIDGAKLSAMAEYEQIATIHNPQYVGDCLGCFGRYPEWMRT